MCEAAIIYVTKKVKRLWNFISVDVQSTNDLQCSIEYDQNFILSRHVMLNVSFSAKATNDTVISLCPSLPRSYLIIHAFTLPLYNCFPSKFRVTSLYFSIFFILKFSYCYRCFFFFFGSLQIFIS